MSDRRPIKCDLCGYEFKLISRMETRYYEYEPHKEECFYPDPKDPNPAHLVRNYICDKCYQKFGDIIRENLINQGELFVDNLGSRIELLQKEYEEKKKILELESERVRIITDKIKSFESVADFDKGLMDDIRKYQYNPFRDYYLESAYYVENERKYNKRKVISWIRYFHISDMTYPDNIAGNDIVSLTEFKLIYQNSRFKDLSISEYQRILDRIDSELKI